MPGFIGFVILIAGFLIQDYFLLLSKWNSITRYPVIFNFQVGTGRVLEKKFGTGRVPGSRQTLPAIDLKERFVNVSVSVDLLKLVDIDEEDYSIEIQFEIKMKWKENRAATTTLKGGYRSIFLFFLKSRWA